jgi:hypothetical protein
MSTAYHLIDQGVGVLVGALVVGDSPASTVAVGVAMLGSGVDVKLPGSGVLAETGQACRSTESFVQLFASVQILGVSDVFSSA